MYRFILFFFILLFSPLPVYAQSDAIHGIDLSHFNGEVQWPVLRKLENRPHFIVLKATEGIDYLDPAFNDHWEAALQHGFIRGAYHFFVAHDDPIAEAQWYIKNVSLQKGDLYPIVDVERATKNEKPGLKQRLQQFLSYLEKHYGVAPIVYTGPNFWNTSIGGSIHDGELWIAQYEVDAPSIPIGWNDWSFWQFTQEGKIAGVEKPVDMNRFSHSRKEFDQFRMKR
ncbi:MAG: hypothetical protein KDD55_13720 [Bdellovibrionales bacterium]|nr:hypothetical protein [Bdellovibrionales bacterium]